MLPVIRAGTSGKGLCVSPTLMNLDLFVRAAHVDVTVSISLPLSAIIAAKAFTEEMPRLSDAEKADLNNASANCQTRLRNC